ncbi:hypothetical protein MMS87_29650, partial [Escherichia coli]|nr:hypothetical protein [Escherichia coli]MCM5181923.1 hypothetical protein [Escherichia coli]
MSFNSKCPTVCSSAIRALLDKKETDSPLDIRHVLRVLIYHLIPHLTTGEHPLKLAGKFLLVVLHHTVEINDITVYIVD